MQRSKSKVQKVPEQKNQHGKGGEGRKEERDLAQDAIASRTFRFLLV